MTATLARPTMDLFDSWAAAVAEFGGGHIDGAGLNDDAAADRATCADLVARAALYADRAATLPDDRVPCDFFWILDDGEVAGFIAFRLELNDFLRRVGGHIGYSVRASRRRRGLASTALGLVLDRARAEGFERVMLTCDDDNIGSARTIEGAGGVLQDVIDAKDAGHPRLRRYWIPLG
ncbi:GNAT family N-acetyltransferase [Microbacterium pseudoresistens]|uniref:Putative acetyltransferase n=1 Tax=Microbacterium pseudoresistens TaxID=640634 RepID=A0A7Y9JNL0_9MICO|nr:GNAT family N-acetyltransferase [Microbacterium pseudoresistens]NYD53814.1 putative acetyltransferase [Microbacterium pseudoresistens]